MRVCSVIFATSIATACISTITVRTFSCTTSTQTKSMRPAVTFPFTTAKLASLWSRPLTQFGATIAVSIRLFSGRPPPYRLSLNAVGKTDNGAFKIYPYKNGDHYYLKATLIGNNFNSAYPIEFTKIDTIDGRWQEDCYDCILQWNIVGNTFLGNDEGLRMRYWQNRIGSYYSRTFAKMNAYGLSSVVYEGNVGKCPAEKANTNNGPNAHTDSNNDWYWVELGNGLYYSLFKPRWATGRLVPDVTESSHFAYNSDMYAVGGNGLGVKYRGMYSDELEVVHNSTVYPWSHFNEAITNGDFFLYGFSCLGKVEQSSAGHSWMIRFV